MRAFLHHVDLTSTSVGELVHFSASMSLRSNGFCMQGGIDQKVGFNPGLTVLVVVVGAVLIFAVGNYMLYVYAQKHLPPRKKKPVSKKKLKRERLKSGMAPAGD
jgi:hypothetical protein